MKNVLPIAILAFTLFLCYDCTRSIPPGKSNTKSAESIADTVSPFRNIPEVANTVQVKLINGEASVKLVKKQGEKVCVEFLSDGNTTLKGEILTKDGTGNIRFSQILLPDGTMDGPFGRDITYELKDKGMYGLAIYENLMADGLFSGEFTIKLETGK